MASSTLGVNKKPRIPMVRVFDQSISKKCAGLPIGQVLSKTSIAGHPSTAPSAQRERPFRHFRITRGVVLSPVAAFQAQPVHQLELHVIDQHGADRIELSIFRRP